MNNESSLIIFERGAAMLQQANTVQKAKELKDMALTAADWANRRRMGQDAIDYAQSYALEAERRMGEMLAETERAKGGRKQPVPSGHQLERPPTLSELKLTKKESARAQKLAAIPRDKFDEVKSGKTTVAKAIAAPKPVPKETKPKSKTTPPPEPQIELDENGDPIPEEEEPHWHEEFLRVCEEQKEMQAKIDTLSRTDSGKEIMDWRGKYIAIDGRLRSVLVDLAEAQKNDKYQRALLVKVRKALRVEANSQILTKIEEIYENCN